MKLCPLCKVTKPHSKFYIRGRDQSLCSFCKDCTLAQYKKWYKKNRTYAVARSKQWRQENPELARLQFRRKNLKKYGVTIDSFADLVRSQKEKCLICKLKFTDTPEVDHCHKTGKTRGLLCQGCNLGIGQFNDSSDRLRAAAKYLDKSRRTG